MTNTGMDAVATDQHVKVAVDSVHGKLDDQGIDGWELQASRRALANLRELLVGQPMLDLLDEQIEEADRRYREYVAASDGKFTGTQVRMTIEGLHSQDFFPLIAGMVQSAGGTEEERRAMAVNMAFPVHPEHYALAPGTGVVETMGGIPSRTRVARVAIEDAPEFVREQLDDSYSIQASGAGELADGTPHSYVLQQFKDTPEGMEANLWIWYAAACPPVYLEEHAQHYAVEFRNGCRLAAAKLNAGE